VTTYCAGSSSMVKRCGWSADEKAVGKASAGKDDFADEGDLSTGGPDRGQGYAEDGSRGMKGSASHDTRTRSLDHTW
ncbi:MAG: hypothetical protein M3121_01980, partial [Chloroflexota bacterium]|nr:hypothetical protein [Chloroflexota bacterium]